MSAAETPAAARSPAARAARVPCTHCGLPAPAPAPTSGTGASAAPTFCCNGCRAAYQMLAAAGLGEFHARRARLGDAPSGVAAEAPEPGRYAHYDSAAFQARFTDPDGSVMLHVDGVHCAACVWVMEQLPAALPGVLEARLDYGRARLHLRYDRDRVDLSAVGAFLHGLGYPTSASGVAAEVSRRRRDRSALIRLGTMFAVTGNTMMIAIALYAGAADGVASGLSTGLLRLFDWASLGLALVAVTYGAWPFYRGAWAGLRMGVPHIDLPISIGVLVGFGGSAWHTVSNTLAGRFTAQGVYYDSVTTLVFLLLLGRYVQARGQRAAMSRTELLTGLMPGSARRAEGGCWVAVAIDALRPGDTVQVAAGEVLPGDGVVAAGRGHVDQSLLTGEGLPVAVAPGDPVFAGTRSVGAPLEVSLQSLGALSRLGRLVDDLERHDAARAPVLQLADRLSGRFVVAILTLAVVGGVAWAFIDPSRAFGVVVSLLVVTCPCALGLATPVALAVARGRAAAQGVLLRSTAAIERLAEVDCVWFDKTGTLTEGRLVVTEATLPEAADRARLAALERRARHPVAAAIVRWVEGIDGLEDPGATDTPEVLDFAEVPGRGVEGLVGGCHLALLSPSAAPLLGDFAAPLARALDRGDTPVIAVRDGAVVGVLALGDRVRPDAAEAVARLRAAGIAVGMLSGDHPAVVARVAERLGITEARGGQNPEDKARAVQAGGGRAAMVGDGFNDAPALRAAHVGIAVHGGAEVALQVADLHLDAPGALATVRAIEGARRALGVVRRNLRFSLFYNVIFASLALAGHISPLAAALLMPLSSLTVIGASVLGRSFTGPGRGGPSPG